MTGGLNSSRLVSSRSRRAVPMIASLMELLFRSGSLARGKLSAFPGPLELPQTAAKRFDLLLVGGLLPLG